MTANAVRLARALALVALTFLAFDLGASAFSARAAAPVSAKPMASAPSGEITELGRFVVTPTSLRYDQGTAGDHK